MALTRPRSGDLGEDKSRPTELILVTAITPTPAGEETTTTVIGEGLSAIGKRP